jgi:flagellar biosynthesis protein FlhB
MFKQPYSLMLDEHAEHASNQVLWDLQNLTAVQILLLCIAGAFWHPAWIMLAILVIDLAWARWHWFKLYRFYRKYLK